MRRYWIKLEQRPEPTVFNLGVGVTAYSEEDARIIAQSAIGPSLRVVSIEVIMDRSQLDQGHVLPNMGNWMRRGVWFPLGYEGLSN